MVPPSLFGTHPSHPDLRNSGVLADLYFKGRLGPDYVGWGGDYIRGSGLNSLLGGIDVLEKDKLKKNLYRNDLLNQMDDNKLRKVEQYRKNRLIDDIEEDRLRRERLLLDHKYNWEVLD